MPILIITLSLPALFLGGAGISALFSMHLKEGDLIYKQAMGYCLAGTAKIITYFLLLYIEFSETGSNSDLFFKWIIFIDNCITLVFISLIIFFITNLVRRGSRGAFFFYLCSGLFGISTILLFTLGFFFKEAQGIYEGYSRIIDIYAYLAAAYSAGMVLAYSIQLEKSRFLTIHQSIISVIVMIVLTIIMCIFNIINGFDKRGPYFTIQAVLFILAYAAWGIMLFKAFSAFALKKDETSIDMTFSEEFITAHNITNREKEVLSYILKGKPNQDIADTMFVSLSTVKSHIHRIFRKTGVKTRIELIHKVNSI